MKIAIIGAMKEELKYFLAALENKKEIPLPNQLVLTTGTIFSHDIFVIQSGIGKVNAASNTTQLLALYPIELVINIGSAGGIKENMEIGDIVIADKTIYHDVDVRAFGYEIGQVPGLPTTYPVQQSYVELCKEIADRIQLPVHIGMIASGDQFVDNGIQKMEQSQIHSVYAIEMEAAAIAQTAFLFKIPAVIIRSISDVANKDSATSFSDFLDRASQNAAIFLVEFLKAL
ncbi:MAG: 5'-methylthioadenosine/adenosylhomocysteine nucleosidase [Culicoidibacterales bacterium]